MSEIAESSRMSLLDHLTELRRRIMIAAIAVLAAALGSWGLREYLFDWLVLPLSRVQSYQLQVISPLEMFMTYLKLTITAGIFMSAPVVLSQAWMFIAPGLYTHEKRWGVAFVLLGTLFFIGGGAFGYFVVLPMSFEYLGALTHVRVTNQYSVELYFGLVMKLLLAFGLVFETPLVMWILAGAGLVRAATLAQFRKYWLVASVVMGALLTDPSPLTQLMMAGPLVIFYELGVLGARLLERRSTQRVTQASE